MLSEMFSGPEFVHHGDVIRELEGAIVIVPVSASLEDIHFLNHQMFPMKWVVLCIVGDEESRFPHHLMVHSNMRIWFMSPVRKPNAS